QLDPSRSDAQVFAPPGIDIAFAPQAATFPVAQQTRSKTNRYAFATLGRRVANGFSFAGSVMYSDLHRLDGVDQLYAGSQSIAQHGGDLDGRVGGARDWGVGAG